MLGSGFTRYFPVPHLRRHAVVQIVYPDDLSPITAPVHGSRCPISRQTYASLHVVLHPQH